MSQCATMSHGTLSHLQACQVKNALFSCVLLLGIGHAIEPNHERLVLNGDGLLFRRWHVR